MLSLGWFSTGRGEGSWGLLRLIHDHIVSGYLPATIQFVFCNRDPGEAGGSDQFHALVQSYGLPLMTLSSRRFRRARGVSSFEPVRQEFDREAMQRLEPYHPDLCVLAGYMLILGPDLCRRFTTINLHPALPNGPIGTWQEVIWQLIEQRATETGAMVHLVIEEVDQGPAVSYCSFSIVGPGFDPLWEQVSGRTVDDLKATFGEELPLFQLIRQEGMKRETPLLLETIRAFAQGNVRVVNRKVVDGESRPIPAYCLDGEIEAWLERGSLG